MNESKQPGDAEKASDPDDLLDIVVVPPNQANKTASTEQPESTAETGKAASPLNGARVDAAKEGKPAALLVTSKKEEIASTPVAQAPPLNEAAVQLETAPARVASVPTDDEIDALQTSNSTGEPDGFMAPVPVDERPKENWLALLVKETLETVVLAVVIFLLIRIGIQNYRIEGSSMEPNFHNGEYLLVNKLAYRLGEFQRGDVVVFKYPGDPTKDYIKRVIGLPGDTVEIRNGVLLVNGQEVTEPYNIMPMNFITEPPVVVEPDSLYVMGDNRPASSDTRDWGLLDEDLVIGQAWLAIYPLEQFGLVDHPELLFTPGMAQGP